MANLIKKSPLFFKSTLLASIVFTHIPIAFALTPEQQAIQQLREEVKALRALVEQHVKPQTQPAEQIVASQPSATQTITNPQDKAPNLTLKTANGAEAKLYGFIRGDAAYQIEGGKSMFNRIHTVSLDDDADKKSTEDKFDSTATVTRVGVDFKTPVQGKDVTGKVEVDFRGTNDALRIRHAYLSYNNWLAGQTTSTFLATDLHPEMIDFNSPLGVGTTRTPMVRYQDKLSNGAEYFIGLEKGRDDNRLPALTSKLKFGFAEGKGSVSMRTLLQKLRARDVNDEKKLSWGLAAGMGYQLNDQFQVFADYSHVKGDDKFLSFNNVAYLSDTTHQNIYLNEIDALTVGATYKFTPQLRSTLGYGLMRADDDNRYAALANDAQNEQLQQIWLNIMYMPVKPVTIGMEYIYGERDTLTGKSGVDHRLGFMARYNF